MAAIMRGIITCMVKIQLSLSRGNFVTTMCLYASAYAIFWLK